MTEHEILTLIINIQLPVYDMTKAFLLKNDILPGDSAWNHLLSSFCAGLCACLASSPVDVIRTRLMDQRVIIPDRKVKKVNSKYAQQTIYKSSWECGLTTIRNEGFLALYKGFVASFMRMGPWNIIFFLTYEKLKQVSSSSSSSTAFQCLKKPRSNSCFVKIISFQNCDVILPTYFALLFLLPSDMRRRKSGKKIISKIQSISSKRLIMS